MSVYLYLATIRLKMEMKRKERFRKYDEKEIP